jgi:type I restriction enzyme S subunit
VEEGDFVYNRLFAWKGSFAVATQDNAGCYVSNEFPCFAVREDRADGRYLWRYFSRSIVWDEALGLSAGGTPTSRNRLKQEKLLSMQIPLPPLGEQRRIVARIEELAAKIEEARTLRQKAGEAAGVLPASLLATLMPRNVHNKRLDELLAPDCRISYGVLVPGPDTRDGVPFVRVQDLDIRNPPASPSKRISRDIDAEYERTRLKGGEILIGVVGSIGKVGIAPASWIGANIARAVCRIRVGETIDRDYLALILSAMPCQEYFHKATRTLAQPTLNVTQLAQTPIPTPPLPEQRRIVAELDAVHQRVDSLRRQQTETAAALDTLLSSILDRAFQGEL